MKARASSLLAVVPCAALFVALAACEKSGDDGNGSIGFESGTFEAGSGPDGSCASPPCTPIDASSGDAPANDAADAAAGPYGDTPPPPLTPNDVFVDPVNGKDTSSGKLAAPFKSIKKGLATVPAGAAVHLLDGTYTTTTEGSTAVLVIPNGVVLRAENYRLAKLDALPLTANQAAAAIYGIVLEKGSTVQANDAVASNVIMSGVQLVNEQLTSTSVTVNGLTKLALHNVDFTGVLRSGTLVVGTDAEVVMTGGTMDAQGNGAPGFGAALIVVNGRAALTLDGVTIKNSKTPGIGVAGSTPATPATITLKNGTLFDTVGTLGNCASAASVIATTNATVVLDKVTMKGSPNAAICIRDGGTNIDFKIKNGSSLSNNAAAIASETGNGANATVAVSDSSIASNTSYGIVWQGDGTFTLANTTMTGNGTALYLSGGANNLAFNVRGSMLTGNGYAVEAFSSTIALDLGTAASAGNNKITGNTTTGLSLSVGAGVVVEAQGNTWNANVQGADAAGHYVAGTIVTGPFVTGTNYGAPNAVVLDL